MTSSTESSSRYDGLEQKGFHELLWAMNAEDQTVPLAVQRALPGIERLAEVAYAKLAEGGRMFYIGAGTSGRLGVLDAAEIPPTYGFPPHRVVGLIAGGDGAIRHAVEGAEDNMKQAWRDLRAHSIGAADILIGISASGSTPYVVGGLHAAQRHDVATGAIVCNAGSPAAQYAHFPVEIVVGPEFVTGSTRLKAGTAQKLTLNMISTCIMIRLGRVRGNKMVDMRLSNSKLVQRGVRIVAEALQISEKEARLRLDHWGNVRKAIEGD